MGLVKVFAVRNLDNLTVKQNANGKGGGETRGREGRERKLERESTM